MSLTLSRGQVRPTSLPLTLDSLRKYPCCGYSLHQTPGWLFHPGHDAQWANPTFDDKNWLPSRSAFDMPDTPPGWNGVGWFRRHIQVDSSLVGLELAMRVVQRSASEIYLDGQKIGGFGKIGATPATNTDVQVQYDLLPFRFTRPGDHILAIRLSARQPYNSRSMWTEQGFRLQIGLHETLTDLVVRLARIYTFPLALAFATGLFALLHLILFMGNPRQRSNLYYSGWLMLSTVDSVCAHLDFTLRDPLWQNAVGYLAMFVNFSLAVTSVAFIYSVGYGRQPRRIWAFVGLAVLLVAYGLLNPLVPLFLLLFGFLFFCTLEVARVVLLAILRRQPGVWLIGVGIIAVTIVFFTGPADQFDLWHTVNRVNDLYNSTLYTTFGYLILPLCTSIYLAQELARTNRNLAAQLQQVQDLSAKNMAQEAEKLHLVAQQNEQLERTVQERTEQLQQQADKLREMDRVKSRFFTNLTHEFRTPLTLMLGPAEQVLAQTKEPTTKQQVGLLQRNAQRLLRLINQLLELSKLEAGKAELTLAPGDLVMLVQGTLHSFESLARQQRITLHFLSNRDQLVIAMDRAKLENILYNLFSNALKFTPVDGNVSVNLTHQNEQNQDWVELEVADTGIGIRAAKLPYVFDRFYQVDASDTREQEGTGIGLALTKELVELHGGTIQIASQEGMGTSVIVQLPVRQEQAIATVETPLEGTGTASPDFTLTTLAHPETKQPEGDESATENPTVLLIEDNEEVRAFIRTSLGDSYRILEAGNGEEGTQLAWEHIPDLIITDLMMPRLDGYKACTILKQDERTSHIPIIMLTARADLESKIEGLQTGADSYLAKPFHQRELLAQITNLLLVRRQLRERYSQVTLDKQTVWPSETSSVPSMEQAFLSRVRVALETHLDDEQYSVDRLCEEVGLGRTQLHRKLKALINQTPGDLLRVLRLQRAHELLRGNVSTVAEVAYSVGFGNPANFSTSFSRHFGYPPSELRKKAGILKD
ncbi:hybrid sensor histidine kinase/response regulator transcription factor [Spirosoma fluminis]